MNDNEHVWYVCYGSNICKERFMCYINGGSYLDITEDKGPCMDTTHPSRIVPFQLNGYELYYAHEPVKGKKSWGGGVAFIRRHEGTSTPGRAYLITWGQFKEIHGKEGPGWYDDYPVPLGNIDGFQAYTFTARNVNQNEVCPSENYRTVIKRGLGEAYPEWRNITVDEDGKISHD